MNNKIGLVQLRKGTSEKDWRYLEKFFIAKKLFMNCVSITQEIKTKAVSNFRIHLQKLFSTKNETLAGVDTTYSNPLSITPACKFVSVVKLVSRNNGKIKREKRYEIRQEAKACLGVLGTCQSTPHVAKSCRKATCRG